MTRTQYDSVLCASQTFTVWAPTNEAIQNSGIDLNDSVYVTKFVENHIARFLHSTSNLQRKSVLMKNLKKLIFAYDGSSYSINGNKLVNTGVAVKNGVVYKVEDVNPYLYNIYEYMEYTPGFDSINTFFKYYESKELDVENSTVIGVNGENQNVYDTVWKYSNTLLSAIGRLDLEDSIYTAILPNNDAWNSAFENRLSYHKIFVDRNTVDPAADSA